jgi:hypothetical protein
MAHNLPISKYILAVMADKSDEKIQRMEGFTSRSDSDIDVVNLSFGWKMGCFDYTGSTKKKLNRFEITLNFQKQLLVSSF